MLVEFEMIVSNLVLCGLLIIHLLMSSACSENNHRVLVLQNVLKVTFVLPLFYFTNKNQVKGGLKS